MREIDLQLAKNYQAELLQEAQTARLLKEAGLTEPSVREKFKAFTESAITPALIPLLTKMNDITLDTGGDQDLGEIMKAIFSDPGGRTAMGIVMGGLTYLAVRAMSDRFDPRGANLRRNDPVISANENRKALLFAGGGGAIMAISNFAPR